jgi:hypothetical protein
VWNGVWRVAGWWCFVGTLLGPEATHVVWVLVASFHCYHIAILCGWVWWWRVWWCGVVFENCIVDASILMA